ncbi:hypothetical protein [Aeromicrobium sp. UC242_57]|uniref:hypothetical protein n=1 Tax=Aeromicrobium sp. UC242_57 TaxID=3374624 RepID=UPI0037A2F86B
MTVFVGHAHGAVYEGVQHGLAIGAVEIANFFALFVVDIFGASDFFFSGFRLGQVRFIVSQETSRAVRGGLERP